MITLNQRKTLQFLHRGENLTLLSFYYTNFNNVHVLQQGIVKEVDLP